MYQDSAIVFHTLGHCGCRSCCCQYCTASPSSCCFVITYRLYRLLFAVWSAGHKTCFSVRASASMMFITAALRCRSSSPSRTFASAVTGALYLDMHVPTRDDAAMSDPLCQIKCRWDTVADCAMVIALKNLWSTAILRCGGSPGGVDDDPSTRPSTELGQC